jgi:hypothetical protein
MMEIVRWNISQDDLPNINGIREIAKQDIDV